MFFRLHGYTPVFFAEIRCPGKDLRCNHPGYTRLQMAQKAVDGYRFATSSRMALETVPAPLKRTALVRCAPFNLLSTVPQL